MNKKSLTFETHPSLIEIKEISDEIVRVQFNGDLAVSVEFNNDVMLASKGDFTLASEGEMSIISKDNPICIDSIDSDIYLNSRKSKLLKDDPKSIEYNRKMITERKSNLRIATMAEMENKTLKQRVTELEEQMEELLKGK